MKEIQAPNQVHYEGEFVVFLAGSIAQGKASRWQEELCASLADEENLTLLNPRRDSWDSTWVADINNAQFVEQVEWELEHIENADMVIVYFDPDHLSPITLLEVGKLSEGRSFSTIVCCPPGTPCKGNVDVTCRRAGITQVESLTEIADIIRNR
jgi:hypothetical protein